jgi:CRP-like cAMP-binding protein
LSKFNFDEANLFGEMSFLDEAAVASASVVAITEVEVYSLHESFASILNFC